MKTKSRPREKDFVPGTSRKRESGVTFRLQMAMDEAQLLAMGARIAELRELSGLKQQAIADHCHVQLRTYQFWQEGKHPPLGDNLQRLSEIFRQNGLDYATPTYILRGATPDLSKANGDDGTQLDRLEQRIEDFYARLGDIYEIIEQLVGQEILRAVEKDIEQGHQSDPSADQQSAA